MLKKDSNVRMSRNEGNLMISLFMSEGRGHLMTLLLMSEGRCLRDTKVTA